MGRWLATLGLAAGVGSCSTNAFVCADNGQCLQAGVQGTCEFTGVCSFPDDDCESGQRFGEFAGALANTCVPLVGTGSSGGDGSTTSDDMPQSSGVTDGVDGDPMLDADGTTGSSSTSTGSTPRPESTDGGDATTDTSGDPLGAMCSEAETCASGHCGVLGALGGVCSECTDDQDCRFGCSLPNLWARPAEPGVCEDGLLGASCQSNEACQGLECSLLIDIPSILSFSTCGECGDTAGCPDSLVCNPMIDFGALAGHTSCVAVSSLDDGMTCTLEDSIDTACENRCAAVSVQGLFQVGVCGECVDDLDCANGTTCIAGSINLGKGETVGSFCG